MPAALCFVCSLSVTGTATFPLKLSRTCRSGRPVAKWAAPDIALVAFSVLLPGELENEKSKEDVLEEGEKENIDGTQQSFSISITPRDHAQEAGAHAGEQMTVDGLDTKAEGRAASFSTPGHTSVPCMPAAVLRLGLRPSLNGCACSSTQLVCKQAWAGPLNGHSGFLAAPGGCAVPFATCPPPPIDSTTSFSSFWRSGEGHKDEARKRRTESIDGTQKPILHLQNSTRPHSGRTALHGGKNRLQLGSCL